jgi:hypothetical protein
MILGWTEAHATNEIPDDGNEEGIPQVKRNIPQKSHGTALKAPMHYIKERQNIEMADGSHGYCKYIAHTGSSRRDS